MNQNSNMFARIAKRKNFKLSIFNVEGEFYAIDDINLDLSVGRYKDLFSTNDDSMELEFINFIYVMWNHFEEFNLEGTSNLDNDWNSIPIEDIQFEDNINTYWINPQNDFQFYRLKRK